ncbi:MAG: leucine-rich repeat domain-containing protein [Bacteroidaceae bacterium]|nr:leucine-rich repeat domain-containing protein [Bacteroidaceae bacterium]
MKSLRRFLLCLLALLVSSMANAFDFEVDGIRYSITTGGVAVRGYNSSATNLVLNGTVTYNGTTYNVVSIAYYAFQNCINLTSVGDLPACTSIGYQAFDGCTSLTSVGNLSACTSIGGSAFSGCTSLEKISLTAPNVATLSSSNAFSKNTTIFVPASLLEAYKAANNWKDIANQILPLGVKTDYDITVYAQENSSAVHAKIGELYLDEVISLKISGTINSYDIMVFRNKMHNLHHLDLTDARIVDNNHEYYTGYHTEDDVLGANSFYDIANLYSVRLPKTITRIGNRAFSNCYALHEVIIHEGLKWIPDDTFCHCHLLSVVIPEGVTSIEYGAFNGCHFLSSISLPSTLTNIGENAFDGCSSLTSITLPEDLENIGSWAFNGCTSLTEVRIPNTVTSIGDGAFGFCSSLTEVRIPSMVTTIGDGAFQECPALKDVWTYTLVPQNIGQGTFSNYTSTTLHVQKTSYDAYYWNTQWSQFASLTEFEGTYKQWLINNRTDYVIDDNTGVIDTDEDATGKIDPGSGLISENEDDEQEMGTIIIEADGSLVGSLIGHGHISSKWLKFHIEVQKAKWYFLCFPYQVPLSDIECEGSWVFRYYDGAARAQNGQGGWKNLPAGTQYLEAGVGYIFQCNKDTKLKIKVNTQNVNLSPGDIIKNLTTYVANNIQDASWNLTGNPFTSYFNMDDMSYESPITIWNGTSYEAVRPGDDDYHFRPFQAFFVQKPEAVKNLQFPASKRETYNQSKKAMEASVKRRAVRGVNPQRLLVNLTLSDGTTTDKTRVVFNDEKTASYEPECDASKFMASGVPQFYSLDGKQVCYSINERPNGDVQLGFSTQRAGTYTIEATRMDKPMLLRDTETGITFDLANGGYEFKTEAGTFNNRFMLVVNTQATGLADIKTKLGVSIMSTLGGLEINGLNGTSTSIYSTDGKLMKELDSDGFVNLKSGIYVVKVGEMKTKVLVK